MRQTLVDLYGGMVHENRTTFADSDSQQVIQNLESKRPTRTSEVDETLMLTRILSLTTVAAMRALELRAALASHQGARALPGPKDAIH
ncbi:MAG: hypothetical protein CFE44_13715 [Burkholderiales bacterium PBB4]|nr:MAG: hypothetical protein CFE44_13715 [Burkholderiales bacterium PBB4]